jgi:hypothetical protein
MIKTLILTTCTLDCRYYDVIEKKRFIHYDVIESVTLLLVIFSDVQYTHAIYIFLNDMQLYR